ncbi:MAG: DUF2461 domain-containing protein [Clostridiales bacterium]|nr:DUF2461 domain-containing protein [Clostridiales bacterium]
MGFTQETLDFLAENRIRGDKKWFHEHKSEYEKLVKAPFFEVCEALAETMLSIDELLIVEPRKTLSRIYRDTRFSKDKSLYRSNMWILFIRDKRLSDGFPAFFFEIGLWGFHYGCGYYDAGNERMSIMRDMLIGGKPLAKKAFESFYNQDVFSLTGDKYKRSRYSQYDERMADWLDRKSICFLRRSDDFEMLYSDELIPMLKRDFPLLKPEYEFLLSIESRRNNL